MLLYIDPGTGSMLFTILIGVVGALYYVLRMAVLKIKILLLGGKNSCTDNNKTPYVIFSDNKRYWNVFEPICREMDKRGINVTYLTASEDDPVFDCKYKCILPQYLGDGNRAYAKMNFLNASIVLSTTPGLDVYQWKRSKDVDYYVHILHAAGEVSMYRMFGLDYYDAVLLGGEFQKDEIRRLERMRDLPAKELRITGIPYMDDMVDRLNQDAKGMNDKKTVLLAPTWGPSGIFSRYGSKVLAELISTGYHIIVRPHPQTFISEKDMIDRIMKEYPESDNVEWNRDVDNFNVLNRADILISDFSGVTFDFALVYDKPIIYTDTKFDTSPYDAWWLEDEIWTYRSLPRLGIKLTEDNLFDIKNLIDRCLEDSSFASGRRQVREECWEQYGNGAQKTVDYLVTKYNEITQS